MATHEFVLAQRSPTPPIPPHRSTRSDLETNVSLIFHHDRLILVAANPTSSFLISPLSPLVHPSPLFNSQRSRVSSLSSSSRTTPFFDHPRISSFSWRARLLLTSNTHFTPSPSFVVQLAAIPSFDLSLSFLPPCRRRLLAAISSLTTTPISLPDSSPATARGDLERICI